MSKFQTTFTIALVTSLIAFSLNAKPLMAIIDHLFDFHPDHSIIPERPEIGYTDKDGTWWEHKALYETDKYYNEGTYGNDGASSGCSEGTVGPPDRDP